MKVCKKCGGFFPASTDYFYKHAQTADGLRAICKDCYKQEIKEKYKNTERKFKRETINKEEIINARKKKKISRRQIAEILGISYYTYAAIETRNKTTDKKVLKKIKWYLDI